MYAINYIPRLFAFIAVHLSDMQWFNRSLAAVFIGCLNILTYTIVCAVLIINLKYYQYSEYDYNEYNDVYESYKQRRETQAQREIYGSIYAGMCIVMDVVSGLLIFGVLEKRPCCISPWILGSFVVFIYSAIVVMDDIFVKSSFQGVANSKTFFATLFVGFGFQLFCLALVYSLYTDIQLEIILNHRCSLSKDLDLNEESQLEENHLNNILESNRKLKTNVSSLPVKLNTVNKSKKRDSKKFK